MQKVCDEGEKLIGLDRVQHGRPRVGSLGQIFAKLKLGNSLITFFHIVIAIGSGLAQEARCRRVGCLGQILINYTAFLAKHKQT